MIIFNDKTKIAVRSALRIVLCAALLQPTFSALALWAIDVEAQLNTTEGSSSFRVSDSGGNEVSAINSDGHLMVLGSVTIRAPYGLSISTMLVVKPGSGNIGIGNLGPGQRLHVSSGVVFVDGNNLISLLTVGNAGIGTTATSSRFDVFDGSITIRGSNAGLRLAAGNLTFANDSVQTTASNPLSSSSTWSAGQTFERSLTINSTHFIVQNGNIGIGANDASSALDINGGSLTIRNPYGLAIGTMMVVQNGSGNIGIGTHTPAQKLHTRENGLMWWMNNSGSGAGVLSRTMTGILLTHETMSPTNKYSPAIKFGSTDANLTTENPKFLAGILARATEDYVDDEGGGMALELMSTLNNPGDNSLPTVRLTIDQSGNIGIGNLAPTRKIHLSSGTVFIDGNVAPSILTVGNIGIGTNSADSALAAYGLIQSTGSNAAIKIHSSGSAPYLQIAGDDADPFMQLIMDSNGGSISHARLGLNSNAGAPYFFINYADNSTAQHITLKNDGNVGIGKPVATQKLQMSSGTFLIDGNAANSILVPGNVSIGSNSPSSRLDIAGGSVTIRNPYGLAIGTMVVVKPATGNVGLGTESPARHSHLRGTEMELFFNDVSDGDSTISRTMSGLLLTSNSHNLSTKYTPAIKFGSTDASLTTENPKFLAGIIGRATETYDADTKGGMAINILTTPNTPGVTSTPDVIAIFSQDGRFALGTNNPSQKIQLSSGTIFIDGSTTDSIIAKGNMSLGTTAAPAEALHVVGRIRMDTWTADGDTAVFKDDGTGNLGTTASDIRLKKNIEPITQTLEFIKKLHAYKYQMLDEPEQGKKKIGIMAQELLNEWPELTYKIKNDTTGEIYYGVHYEKLSVLLITAIHEYQLKKNQQIQYLQKEISALKERITKSGSTLRNIK